jgi:hypothetical protein
LSLQLSLRKKLRGKKNPPVAKNKKKEKKGKERKIDVFYTDRQKDKDDSKIRRVKLLDGEHLDDGELYELDELC